MDRKLGKLLDKARANVKKGKVRSAMKYYQKACEYAPRDPVSWQEIGMLAISQNDTTAGVDALFRAADLYAQVGGVSEAIPLCDQILSVASDHDGARNILRVIERRSALRRQATAGPTSSHSPPPKKSNSNEADNAIASAAPPPLPATVIQGDRNPPRSPVPPPQSRATVQELIESCIATSSLLQQLGPNLVHHLATVTRLIELSPGEVVFSQGDMGTNLFLVLDGAVDVVRKEGDTSRLAATLETGALFGEMALLGGPPRTATIRTQRPTVLAEISQQTIRNLIKKDARVLKILIRFFRERMVDNVIATSAFLSHLSLEQRRAITSRFRVCDLPTNHVVITEGKQTNGLYLVLAGRLSVWVGESGGQKSLGHLGPGDVFGEMALLEGTVASATVRTDERVWLLRLPARDFEQLMTDHPSLRAELKLIAQKRRQRNQLRLR